MTTLNLDEIEQRAQAAAVLAEAATAGPWDGRWVYQVLRFARKNSGGWIEYEDTPHPWEEDTAFIAASRTAVPALAADVAALVAEVKRLTAQVDDLTVAYNASMGILGKSLLGDDFQMPPFKPGGE